MKPKFFIFPIIFLFFVSFCFASYTTIYSENFDFCGELYTTRAWLFGTSAGNWTDYPIYNSNLGSCAYGYNSTQPGTPGSFFSTTLSQETPTPLTSGIIKVSFLIETSNNTLTAITNRLISVVAQNKTSIVSETVGQPLLYLNFYEKNISIEREYTSTSKTFFCGLSIIRPYSLQITWLIDVSNYLTSLEIINSSNGETLINCIDQNFINLSYNGIAKDINKFSLYSQNEQGRTYGVFIDNFKVEIANSSITSNLPVGTYCDSDTVCLTGFCLRYKCSYKTETQECTSSSQCLSGSCLNFHCTKESLFQGIDQSKSELWGNDTATNNFIALLFIIFITVLVSVKSHFLVGVGTFIVLSIFFTVIGWLSPFLLIGGLILILGSIAMLMFFGSNNG
jgi:hypothetical protein